jgi:glycosyltransferase involved in cell wall biosynthesis
MTNLPNELSGKVTIVVPAYNASKFLKQTLISAIQASPSCVIVVDDGSTDSTFDIATRFSKAFPLVEVFTKSNAGESSAINFGLRHVKTPYVLFLSADDLIEKSLLSKAVQILEDNKCFVAAYPSWKVISGVGDVIGEVNELTFSISRLVGNLECLPGPGSVLRTSSLLSGRNEDLKQIPDLEQWLRLVKIGPLIHLPEVLASWRTHESNLSLNTFGRRLSLELDVIFETVRNLFVDDRPEYLEQPVWEEFLINWHRRKAIAETQIVGSLRSIPHLYLSWFHYFSASRPRPNSQWSFRGVIGALVPPLIWLRNSVSILRARL